MRSPTLAETLALLALSRGGELPKSTPPNARRSLLRQGWIAPPRPFTLTEDGRAALAASKHLGQAQRELDRPPPGPARTGMGKRMSGL